MEEKYEYKNILIQKPWAKFFQSSELFRIYKITPLAKCRAE